MIIVRKGWVAKAPLENGRDSVLLLFREHRKGEGEMDHGVMFIGPEEELAGLGDDPLMVPRALLERASLELEQDVEDLGGLANPSLLKTTNEVRRVLGMEPLRIDSHAEVHPQESWDAADGH